MRINPMLVLTALLICECSAHAQGNLLTDGSFENITVNVRAPSALGVSTIGTNSGSVGAWNASAGTSIVGLVPGSVSSGTATSLGGPTPSDGSFETQMILGLGVGSHLSLSQALSSSFQANSDYNFSIDMVPGSNLSLLSQTSLSLLAGTTTVDSISGSSLISLLHAGNAFETVNLNYNTGSVAPTGNISVAFSANSVASLAGTIYLDNAQFNLVPTPEPNATILMGMGLSLLAAVNRFRKLA